MPEEINRIVTDVLADFLFVSEPSGIENLTKEGIQKEKIFFVGNIMIDSLIKFMDKIERENTSGNYNVNKREYILVTFHRPSNVDDPGRLEELLKLLARLSRTEKIIFPIHPRSKKNIEKFDLAHLLDANIIITEPIGYLEFLSLVKNAKLVITDSGGIQEESTFMKVPCITARDDTERPVTINIGTNHLGGTDFQNMDQVINEVLKNPKEGKIPEKWDGNTAERIVDILMESNNF